MKLHVLLGCALAMFSAAASAQTPVPDHFQNVGKIIGKAGDLDSGGSYRINFPRNDVEFTSENGMPIPSSMGLSTYIAMSGTADRVLAVGDVAMLGGEIDGVIDALRAGGFSVVALHNHMTTEVPRLFYTHFEATGNPDTLATSFKKVLGVLGHGSPRPPAEKLGKPTLDPVALSAILGGKPQNLAAGVLRFSSPRKDLAVSIDGEKFTPGMGLGSWAAFFACPCGQTMVMGDTCCESTELQSVIDALRNVGIHITSIHNHFLSANHEVIFLHYEGEADSLKLAAGVRAAWDTLGKAASH